MTYRKGLLITFEGIEGSGKSTQAIKSLNYLKSFGYRVQMPREPGSTYVGEIIRSILKHDSKADLDTRTELLLFLAARAQLVAKVIKPYLQREGGVVLCDRFMDSSTIYQGYASGLGIEKVNALNEFAINEMVPDLTILIDTPVEVGFARLRKRKEPEDRIEKAGMGFHRKVRAGYLELAQRHPERIKVVHGGGVMSSEEIFEYFIKPLLFEAIIKKQPL